MISAFTLNFFQSGVSGNWGQFYARGLLNFGVFQCPEDDKMCHLWQLQDLGEFNVTWIIPFIFKKNFLLSISYRFIVQ